MPDGVERMLPPDGRKPEGDVDAAVLVLLEHLEARRDSLIMELRGIERILIRYDRLKSESIPRRHR